MSKTTDVYKKASALEVKMQGPFLGGNTPSAEDVKEFNNLLGEKNVALYRWVKHMASYTEAERNSWGAPTKKLPDAAAKKDAAKTEAKPAIATKKADAKKEAPKPAAAKKDDEDDIDLFGEETEEEAAALEEKKKKDAEAKAATQKKKPVAKSSILVEVKAWEDTTDLDELAKKIKAVEKEGLTWGSYKLVPVAFGVKKLVLMLTIVDDLVTSDDLEDIIVNGFEEEVQSMDIAAWNKL